MSTPSANSLLDEIRRLHKESQTGILSLVTKATESASRFSSTRAWLTEFHSNQNDPPAWENIYQEPDVFRFLISMLHSRRRNVSRLFWVRPLSGEGCWTCRR